MTARSFIVDRPPVAFNCIPFALGLRIAHRLEGSQRNRRRLFGVTAFERRFQSAR
jgi:hypothetical protein